MTLDPNPEFEDLLNYIKRNRGFDFTGYKRSTLMRRVEKRMQTVGIESISEYIDYLEVDPQEFVHLFNTILINVTSFFRDCSTWDYIATKIIPQITEYKELNAPIRVWSAGCASGQEAYTLAIVFAEALGLEALRSRVKIYATDVDEEALHQGRQGIYDAKEVAGVPPELLEKYFDRFDGQYTFRKDLRRSVIFGRHNLVQDAPISRIDLLVCRNSLMYFNAEAQAKIITRFAFALNEGGFLFLGKAEMLINHSNTFKSVDLKRRIFINIGKVSRRDRSLLMLQNSNSEEVNYLVSDVNLRHAAFDVNPVAQVVVDLNGLIILANERARSLFGLNHKEICPLQDLQLSHRGVELRAWIEQAYTERRPTTIRDVEWTTFSSSDRQYFDVLVTPLLDMSNILLGVSITFIDITPSKRLQEELEHSNKEVEMAYEELQSTNEELETTSEELQSSNEELETTNEELQSTNEELETMNEELQSTNEELQTLNEEIRLRSDKLNETNTYLASILTSLRGGVVVVDRDLQVQIWNYKAEDLWGLRTEEVKGQHFLNLDIGLPVEQLLQAIRTCLLGQAAYTEVTVEATNRRGRGINCKVTCTPMVNTAQEIRGVIMLMEETADVET